MILCGSLDSTETTLSDPSDVSGRAILTLRSVEIHLSDQKFVSSDDAFSIVSLFLFEKKHLLALIGYDLIVEVISKPRKYDNFREKKVSGVGFEPMTFRIVKFKLIKTLKTNNLHEKDRIHGDSNSGPLDHSRFSNFKLL